MTRIRTLGFVVTAAAAGWAVARGTAQPPPPPVKEVPAILKGHANYTAIPAITVPMAPFGDHKHADGKPVMYPDRGQLHARLLAAYPRPIQAGGPAQRNVRIAQVNEGTLALYRTWERHWTMSLTRADYMEWCRLIADVYRAAAELEDTPAGKVTVYEEWVRAIKGLEWFTEARILHGTETPIDFVPVRFFRLQAEAELLKLKGG